jgi:light-regulated signal transduction histidine kinase (bacteriophytochrome)
MLSLQLVVREEASQLTYRMQLNAVLARLMGALSRQQDLAAGLSGQSADLLAVTGSSGAAVVFQGQVQLVGQTPDKTEVLALAGWLQEHAAEVSAFDRLQEAYAPARDFAEQASGLLAISVSRVHPNCLLWFRPEVVTTVRWGGNPAKPAEAESKEPTRLHPRKSFEAWVEIVRGRSAPWQRAEMDAARELRSGIIEVVLHHAERFAEVTEQLARTSKELETISYTVSHDLRAPLRAMYGYADALLHDAAPRLVPEDVHRLGRISSAAHRLDRMIRDVLRYSHVSRMEIARGAVELDKLVRTVIATEPSLDTHRDAIKIVDPLPTLVSSPELVKDSIAALLSNAVKFVPSGRTPRVKVRAEERPDCVRLWCEDNGAGITPEFQERVFSMFERIHSGQDTEGNGVGLAIVKRAIARLGGKVGVESTPGEGSRFCIDLPRV